jgi:diguanylate cyclase
MVFYSVHYIYSISIIFFAPILFTAFYGKYSLTTNVAIITIGCKLISDYFIYYDGNKPSPFESGISMMNMIISTLLLIFFYGISMVIIYFQKKKNMAVIQKEYERQTMQKQLLTDPLTHINNRLALLNVFQEMNQSIKSSHYYLAMIDLDFFKKVNDSLGHVKGDECLQEIGKILKKHSSKSITPFRFGGDEFCILFEEISLEEVLQICDTLRQQISETFIKNFDLHLTISIGIAKYTTDMFAEDLLQNADTALINETISCCMLNKGTSF